MSREQAGSGRFCERSALDWLPAPRQRSKRDRHHSQIGAEFGYGLAWTFVLSFPLMVVIQEIAAEIGRVTGVGIARNLKRHYRPALWPMVSLLLIANIVNLGADLSAMGAAMALLIGGSGGVYTLLFGILCLASKWV